jgi:hypothetical protein
MMKARSDARRRATRVPVIRAAHFRFELQRESVRQHRPAGRSGFPPRVSSEAVQPSHEALTKLFHATGECGD